MKKLMAICLMLMLVMASASAAEWQDGLSPQKPYVNQPEVDFSKTIGHMLFHPNSLMSVAGGKTLQIYLPREDVKAGSEGTLTLRSADRGTEWQVSFSNTEYINQRAMYEQELDGLMWGSGTCFEITLPISLRLGQTYYVDLSENCIIDEVARIGNPAFRGNEQNRWQFETIGEYGVSEMEYRRAMENGDYTHGIGKPAANDEARFDIVLGGEAKLAVLYVEHDISFEMTNFTENSEVIGTVTGEDPNWLVMFFDEEGNLLRYQEF